MPYLVLALLVVALVALVALGLSLRLARAVRDLRVRLDAALGAGLTVASGDGDLVAHLSAARMFPVGIPVRPFAVEAEDGSTLTDADLTRGTLVAVLSQDCGPCRERVPSLLAAAQQVPGGPESVVVAVVDSPAGGSAYSAQLAPHARLVSGAGGDALAEALSVGQFPFFVWMGDDGMIALGGLEIDLDAMPAGSHA